MTNYRSSFFIEGTPIPQGSKVARVINGRAVMFEANKGFKEWRSTVALAASHALHDTGHIWADAIDVEMDFVFMKPPSVKRNLPSVKPDLDKLCRLVNDGLVQGQLIKDDALIVRLTATKRYSTNGQPAGVFVRIRHAENIS